MSIGLIALLDDIAGLAKVAAASIDDVTAQAGKAVGERVQKHEVFQARPGAGGGEEGAGEEPHRHEEEVHDGVEALRGGHPPGEAEAEGGESEGQDQHQEQGDRKGCGREAKADERGEEQEEEALSRCEDGSAEHFAQHDGAARDGCDEDGLQEPFVL